MRIEIRSLGAGDEDAAPSASALFDDAPDRAATRRFLSEPRTYERSRAGKSSPQVMFEWTFGDGTRP